ncbi:LUD domain-containing protein [Hymenobacter sp. BT559]|uniref:LutC/YkgG family protein n=1 Tax=Hymenobacter sp. BT559 TaxID=2795729 RepID=UPI0018EDDFBF|nr:LUD domain-containing protein [Hymenobacter sp. BT559]MBJ6143577.1 LUD domain-containing protein [Hymenobacter sp. BT559]
MSSRDTMLARIRTALATGPAPQPPQPDWTAPVHPPLPDAELAVTFAASFRRIGGEFFYCETLAQLGTELRAWLAERLPDGQQFYVWEPALQKLLSQADVPFQATEADFKAQAAVGLTSCEALVARTGSIVVAPATASGRRLSIYPDQHIVLARPSQVVAEIGDALRAVQSRYGAELPSMMSLTTGPSRTADIEKTLVLGAHGPRRLTLFLLEDDA